VLVSEHPGMIAFERTTRDRGVKAVERVQVLDGEVSEPPAMIVPVSSSERHA